MRSFDKIVPSHGSGGRLTQELLTDVFLRHFGSPSLKSLDDGAVFPTDGGEYVTSTDSFVVTPCVFPGGDIGKLSIAGTVNDLAAMGAEPLYLTVAFILEAGLDIELLERLVVSMARTATDVGVQIITGDTKVIESSRPSGPELFINTTGIGRIYQGAPGEQPLEAGDAIIVSGGLAEHGFAILSRRLDLTHELESDCAPLWSMVKRVLDTVPVKFMRDPTRGGIAAVLNEIVEGRSYGIRLFEDRLPVKDEVLAMSELLGISPLEVASEGRMVFIAAAAEAERVLETLRTHPLGDKAASIGEVVSDPAGKVVVRAPYGTDRLLPMPLGEQLPRIC